MSSVSISGSNLSIQCISKIIKNGIGSTGKIVEDHFIKISQVS